MTPQRPISGGTHNGSRPRLFTYWRVGYGQKEGLELDFWVEQAGEYHCDPPHEYAITEYQLQRWTRIFYVTQGSAEWMIYGNRSEINAGDLLVLPPRQPGLYRCLEPLQYHWLALVGQWPSFWGRVPNILRWSPGVDAELLEGFSSVRETLILKQSGYALKAISHFYGIFSRIQTLANQDHQPSSYPEPVRNALIYLEETCTQPFNAAEAAASVNISASHLRALFEKWVGESPKSYHT
ncbi:MAG: AraC family ligand binding domain-containing protein, partial [Chloroflexota bacterium]